MRSVVVSMLPSLGASDPKRTLSGFGSEIAHQKSPAPLRHGSVTGVEDRVS
jgi:hypothetical protein